MHKSAYKINSSLNGSNYPIRIILVKYCTYYNIIGLVITAHAIMMTYCINSVEAIYYIAAGDDLLQVRVRRCVRFSVGPYIFAAEFFDAMTSQNYNVCTFSFL